MNVNRKKRKREEKIKNTYLYLHPKSSDLDWYEHIEVWHMFEKSLISMDIW